MATEPETPEVSAQPLKPPSAKDLREKFSAGVGGFLSGIIGALGMLVLWFVKQMSYFSEYIALQLGQVTIIGLRYFLWLPRAPYRVRNLIKQMNFVGVQSTFIVVLTGAFTGAVFALQSSFAFSALNAEYLIGPIVIISLCRELGPVMGTLMIIGRAGSAMAAEIGTMRVTEQVDALYTMGINPIHYLVVPRITASLIMIPLMVSVFVFSGSVGCYAVAVGLLDINPNVFIEETIAMVDLDDLYNGLFKSVFFAFILAVVGCYKGLYTSGGAEGVGKATTESVVVSSVSILIADYFLTALLYE